MSQLGGVLPDMHGGCPACDCSSRQDAFGDAVTIARGGHHVPVAGIGVSDDDVSAGFQVQLMSFAADVRSTKS